MGPDDKQCSRCNRRLPPEAFAKRTASPDGLQNYCRSCSGAWAREHRPRKLVEPPPVADGQKWCRRCDTVKDLDDFPAHSGTRDGRQTYCRGCFGEIYRARRARDGRVTRPAQVPPGHKFCRGCLQVKPLSEWTPRKAAADGYQFRCRECMSERSRARHLAAKYGLSASDVAELLAQQNGICIICLRAPAAHIDHDHATGEVRGMLCFPCNAALGQLGDDVDRVRRAADYLQGKKIVMRQIQPGAVQITYPDPFPPLRPAPRPGPERPPFDVTPLREAALRA